MTLQGLPWANTAVVTVAASPLVSPWIDAQHYSQIVTGFLFTGGTSVHSIEGSFDGVNPDADITYAAPTNLAVMNIVHPYFRWKTVQTVADATKSKVIVKTRA
jgi:hypothetical protein